MTKILFIALNTNIQTGQRLVKKASALLLDNQLTAFSPEAQYLHKALPALQSASTSPYTLPLTQWHLVAVR